MKVTKELKKVLCAGLAGCLILGCLAGCGGEKKPEDTTPANVTSAPQETDKPVTPQETAEEEANGYYEAGRAYLYGLDGKEVNLESAHTNFEKAEQLGKVEANFYLGVLYDFYSYPKQDLDMARAYYEKCGDNPYAQLALGFLYFGGQGVEKDKERAKKLFQSAVDQGCVEGYLGIGSISYDEEKYEAALENYTKASEGTEQLFTASAMNDIGDMYYMGYGVGQDYAAAMEWYKKAADLGNASAMSTIGFMYYAGYGVAQDYTATIEWTKKAADLGNLTAISNIAYMYFNGIGVAQDYAAAMEWYKKAADLGEPVAMNQIGWLYQNGYGVNTDYAAAMEWYTKAADLGNEAAQKNVEYLRNLMRLQPEKPSVQAWAETPGFTASYIFSEMPFAAYEVTGLGVRPNAEVYTKHVIDPKSGYDYGVVPFVKLDPSNTFVLFYMWNPVIRSSSDSSLWEANEYVFSSTTCYPAIEGYASSGDGMEDIFTYHLTKRKSNINSEDGGGLDSYNFGDPTCSSFTEIYHSDAPQEDAIYVKIPYMPIYEYLKIGGDPTEETESLFKHFGATDVREISVEEALEKYHIIISEE